MPNIYVDEEVFAELQKRADAFVDTPNDVMRRLLGFKGSKPQKGVMVKNKGATVQGFTPQVEFRLPILKSLVEMGGSGATGEVLDRVFEKMKDRLTEGDHGETSSGKIRYRHHAEWERRKMREEGLISAHSRHGEWQITEKGRAYL